MPTTAKSVAIWTGRSLKTSLDTFARWEINFEVHPTAVIACNCYNIIISEISGIMYIYYVYYTYIYIYVNKPCMSLHIPTKPIQMQYELSKEERNQCHNFLCWFLGFSYFLVCCPLSCSNFTSS